MKEVELKEKYYPMMVEKEIGDIFDKLHSMPQEIQDILLSEEINELIFLVEKKYQLSDMQTEEFSRFVRKYFFGEVTEGEWIQKIMQICSINQKEALQISSVIKNIKIKDNNREIKELTLSEILKEYPEIMNQIITKKAIVAKPFLKPLKPSIKNWIIVYEKLLGVDKHTTIERGEFVFRSEATKGLDESERQKLLSLLKSRDEDTKLTVDLENKKIIFETEKEKKVVQEVKNEKEVENEQNTQKEKKDLTQNNEINIIQNKKEQVVSQERQKFDIEYISHEEVKSKNPQIIRQDNVSKKNEEEDEYSVDYNIKERDAVISENIQDEIAINRAEMNSQPIKKDKTEQRSIEDIGIKLQQDIPDKQGVTDEDAGVDVDTNIDDVDQEEGNLLQGSITFSSNHVLPAEKK